MTIEKTIEYGKWILMIVGVSFGISITVYNILNADKDLVDYGKWYEIKDSFEKELKGLNLPPKTAVNSFENGGKRRSSILVSIRYRTELSSEEFLKYFDNELKKKGWVYQDNKSRSSLAKYNYQRGKFRANLYSEGSPLGESGANYFQLSYSLGLN